MNKVLFVCLFALFTLSLAQVPVGTYRQCNFNTGDETILTVESDGTTTMKFYFGGCLDGEVQYEVIATYDWDFTSTRTDGGSNVEYHYHSAVATAYTSAAVEALQDTCNSRFTIGEETNVLGCLFCPVRYDIYMGVESDIFVLGDGIACSENDRPTQYEESKFVLSPYYASSGIYDDGDDFDPVYYFDFTSSRFSYSTLFPYFFDADEDDEGYDDDFEPATSFFYFNPIDDDEDVRRYDYSDNSSANVITFTIVMIAISIFVLI